MENTTIGLIWFLISLSIYIICLLYIYIGVKWCTTSLKEKNKKLKEDIDAWLEMVNNHSEKYSKILIEYKKLEKEFDLYIQSKLQEIEHQEIEYTELLTKYNNKKEAHCKTHKLANNHLNKAKYWRNKYLNNK